MNNDGLETVVITRIRKYYPDSNFVFFLFRATTQGIFGLFFFTTLFYHWKDIGSIACLSNKKTDICNTAFSTYCWVKGTHTVLRLHDKYYNRSVPYPGIGQQIDSEDILLNQWAYIWVYPFLTFSWILSNLPWKIWSKYLDGQRILLLIQHCDVSFSETTEVLMKKKETLTNYFMMHQQSRFHNAFAARYIACEVFRMLITLGTMYLMDKMLNGEFSLYGWEVLSFLMKPQDHRMDPMTKVFPKLTICHLHIAGPSGSLQLLEGLCVLPMNAVFEKAFFFLWFWYYFLAFACAIGMVYRAITVFVRPVRFWLLSRQAKCSSEALRIICEKSSYGDWLVIFTLQNIVGGYLFDDFLEVYAEKLNRI